MWCCFDPFMNSEWTAFYWTFCVFGSCFRTLAVILVSDIFSLCDCNYGVNCKNPKTSYHLWRQTHYQLLFSSKHLQDSWVWNKLLFFVGCYMKFTWLKVCMLFLCNLFKKYWSFFIFYFFYLSLQWLTKAQSSDTLRDLMKSSSSFVTRS